MTREEAIAFFKDMNECTYGNLEAVEMAIQALSQEPTVQDKQAESEKYQKAFDDGYANGYIQARFDYEQEPCTDAVSREAVIKTINNNTADERDGWLCIDNDLVHEIEKLPPVNPQPCDDAISRDAVLEAVSEGCQELRGVYGRCEELINELPSITQKSGKCKNCKYFEYDSVAKVDGIPLIVAHEICNKWGDGCKTKEDGYCFLYEPQESEDKE